MKNYNYVYRIINLKPQDDRKYYIGVRSCDCLPEEDIKYMSSSKYLKEAITEQGQENFKKEILSIWESREEAISEEIRLHEEFDVKNNPSFYNTANQLINSFDCNNKGKVTVIDLRDNTTKQVSTDEYKNNAVYVSINQGKKRTSDQIKQMSNSRKGIKRTLDSRTKQSETMKGHEISEKTKKKISKANSNRERPHELRDRISKKLKGTKQSDETRRKKSLAHQGKIIPEETIKKRKIFYSKKFIIIDESGKIQYERFSTKSDMMKFSELENLPFNNFYKNLGNEIMVEKIDPGNLKRFEEKGWFPKFKGWKMIIEETKK